MAFRDPEVYRAYMRRYMARRRAGEPPVRPSVKPDDVKPCVNPSDHEELAVLRAENAALRAEVERLRADVKPDVVKPNESVEPNLLRADTTFRHRVFNFGQIGVGESRFYPYNQADTSNAARAYRRDHHDFEFKTKRVDGGTLVTRVATESAEAADPAPTDDRPTRPVPQRRNRSEAGAPDAEGGELGAPLHNSAEISTEETSEDAAPPAQPL